MDPAVVESGCSSEEGGAASSEPEDEDGGARSHYLQSGLYPSFTVSSRQHALEPQQPIKMEPRSEVHEDSASVIRFTNHRSRPSLPSTPPPAVLETSYSPRPSPQHARSSSCSSSPPQSPAHRLWRGRGHWTETGEFDQSAQPLNLSSGQRARVRSQSTTTPERRGTANGAPLKSRKPKGLEISASSLLLTGNDLVSIALNSPALPSGSMTPSIFTAQVRHGMTRLLAPLV